VAPSDLPSATIQFRRCCDAAGFELNDEETKAALNMLSKSNGGAIEFGDFADWMVKAGK